MIQEKIQKNKHWWLNKFDDGMFLIGMFSLYFKRNKMWESSWDEIVGIRFHHRDVEWCSEYDEFDGDFIECFILIYNGEVVRKCFLFSDFLEWQEKRTN